MISRFALNECTHVCLVHRIAVFNTAQPILRLVLGINNPSINELEECGLRVAIVLAETLQKFVCFPKIEDIERAPGLAGTDIEPALALREE